MTPRVVAHELSHNFGTHHASSLTCTSGGQPVSISSTCTVSEYGDPFDVMGNALRQMSACHKEQIGALPTTATQTVTTLVSSGLTLPYGVAVDGSGNVYFSDYAARTIGEWQAD